VTTRTRKSGLYDRKPRKKSAGIEYMLYSVTWELGKVFFIITSPEYILRDIFVRAVFLVLGNLSTTCKLIEMAMANSNGKYSGDKNRQRFEEI